MDELKVGIIGLCVIFVLFLFISGCEENSIETEVHKYRYLVVDGRSYITSYIEDIDYTPRSHGAGEIKFTLKDGTVIHCGTDGYTLTNTDKGE